MARSVARGLAGHGVLAALLALAVAAEPSRLVAQNVQLLDEGRFRHLQEGREVGLEIFAIRRNGARLEAVARITDGEDAPLAPMEVRLRLDGQRRPEEIRLRIEGAEGRSVAAVRSDDRIRLEVVSPAGRLSRELLAPAGISMLEPGVAHHYHLLLRQHVDALSDGAWLEASAVVPSRAGAFPLRLRREGPDSVRVAGTSLSAVRHTVVLDGEEIRVWLDGRGRVLRVERPERDWSAERTEVIRP